VDKEEGDYYYGTLESSRRLKIKQRARPIGVVVGQTFSRVELPIPCPPLKTE